MKTFLTHIGYNKSLQQLDDHRLGAQRVDARKLLMILGGHSNGYEQHPSIQMWRGWELSLCMYGAAACYQWRLVRNNECDLYAWFADQANWWQRNGISEKYAPFHDAQEPFPPWCKDLDLMRSHRSNLIRMAPLYYSHKWPNTPENMPYLWPINDTEEPNGYRLVISIADFGRLKHGERELPDYLDLDEINRRVTPK